MNPMVLVSLIKGGVEIAGKVMDGRKTKTGVALAAGGAVAGTFSVMGIDVTPDSIARLVEKLMSLFGYSFAGEETEAAVQSVTGSIVTLIGSALALYGYSRKGKLITK